MAELSNDKICIGYLSKVRTGLFGSHLEPRYFALSELAADSKHASLAKLDASSRGNIVGVIDYYLNDVKCDTPKGSYLISKFSCFCDLLPTNSHGVKGLCFVVRGILDRAGKEVILCASNETDKERWVNSINAMTGVTILGAGYLHRQPTAAGAKVKILTWKRQFFILRSFRRSTSAIHIDINIGGDDINSAAKPSNKQKAVDKVGLLNIYANSDLLELQKPQIQYELLRTTHCYILENAKDNAIPSEHRSKFPFMLCDRVSGHVAKTWIYMAASKEERAFWVDEINRLLDFKVCYAGTVTKKGRVVAGWKKRYMIISSSFVSDGGEGRYMGYLTYFIDDTWNGLKNEKGRIQLSSNFVVEKIRAFDVDLPKGGDHFGVLLYSESEEDKREFRFTTESEKERDKIIKELNLIIDGENNINFEKPANEKYPDKPLGGSKNHGSAEKLNEAEKTHGYGGSDQPRSNFINSNTVLKQSAAAWKKGGGGKKATTNLGGTSGQQTSATSQQSAQDIFAAMSASSSINGSTQNSNDLFTAMYGGSSGNSNTTYNNNNNNSNNSNNNSNSSNSSSSSSSSSPRSEMSGGPPAPTPAPAPEPTVWRRKTDGTDTWYVDVNTGESAWEIPPGGILFTKSKKAGEEESGSSNSGSGAADDAAAEEQLPEGWSSCLDENGRKYYYHKNLRVSRWDRPSEDVASSIRQQEVHQKSREEGALKEMRRRNEEATAAQDAKSKAQQEMKETVNIVIKGWRFKNPNLRDPLIFSNHRSLPELLELLPTICYLVSQDVIIEGLKECIEPSVVKRQYMKILRIIHPDKLPADITFEQRALIDEILLTLNDSYEIYKAALE